MHDFERFVEKVGVSTVHVFVNTRIRAFSLSKLSLEIKIFSLSLMIRTLSEFI